MEKLFSISETAKIVGMTTEALRHYDRIDLVKPCKVDEWTGYRYYSEGEIVILNTVKLLRCMEFTLAEIKELLSYRDYHKIVRAFDRAERIADEKIAELNGAKTKIARARSYYEQKLNEAKPTEGEFVRYFPERVILLSDTLESPTLDNLWSYQRHFYRQLPKELRKEFAFEDVAGVYESNGRRRLFAVCTKYRQTDGLIRLPKGNYLCADCSEETCRQVTEHLIERAKSEYHAVPRFTLQSVVLSGILQWNYQAQVFLSESCEG